MLSNIGEEVKGEEEEKKGSPAQPLVVKRTPVNNTVRKPVQQPIVQKSTQQ